MLKFKASKDGCRMFGIRKRVLSVLIYDFQFYFICTSFFENRRRFQLFITHMLTILFELSQIRLMMKYSISQIQEHVDTT